MALGSHRHLDAVSSDLVIPEQNGIENTDWIRVGVQEDHEGFERMPDLTQLMARLPKPVSMEEIKFMGRTPSLVTMD